MTGTGLTPEQRDAAEEDILTALKLNPAATKAELAHAVGLDYFQLHYVIQHNPGFAKRFNQMREIARQYRTDQVEDAHYDLATGKSKDGNVIAQIHWLKHNRKAVYGDKAQTVNHITVNIDKAQINLANQSAPQIEGLAEEESSDESA